MTWQHRAKDLITKLTGYEIRKASSTAPAPRLKAAPSQAGGGQGKQPAQKRQQQAKKRAANPAKRTAPPPQPEQRLRETLPGDRLLDRPVFVLSSIRSGSTLLRVILNSHSQILAPHELHLAHLRIRETTKYIAQSNRALSLDERELEYLLWDRILAWQLERSGKKVIVDKTPHNSFVWRRLVECWPEVKFIYLLRHPMASALSRLEYSQKRAETLDYNVKRVLRYVDAVEDARSHHAGLTVKYEDLTSDAAGVSKQLCEFLDVDWEPSMLEYGDGDHGAFKAGLGDWGKQIKSGRVQPARPLPPVEEVHPALRQICRRWGYLPDT